jgi:dynamin GTPase
MESKYSKFSKILLILFSYKISFRNVFKEHKTLELSVENTEELDTWKASFLRAGVYPEREQRQDETSVNKTTKFSFK